MLDIIIPVYNNQKGLEVTLKSIPSSPLITITVVDDCSTVKYNNLIVNNWFTLKKNSGPGVARQYGVDHTQEPYIAFIDAGDYFSENAIKEIITTIQEQPQHSIYCWNHTEVGQNGEVLEVLKYKKRRVLGYVYKREFLETYHITFSVLGSYADEDIGFNMTCDTILKCVENCSRLVIDKSIINKTQDMNSLTHKFYNGLNFRYGVHNKGLAYNILHAVEILKENNIDESDIASLIYLTMVRLYRIFYSAIFMYPQGLAASWEGAQFFYTKIFKQYENKYPYLFEEWWNKLRKYFYEDVEPKDIDQYGMRPNIQRFLSDLENHTEVPPWYFLEKYNGNYSSFY